MFDKLEDMLIHLEEILNMLNEPDVINDPPQVPEADEGAE